MVDFEHTLFILLLLSGVLTAKPPRPRWAALSILLGILLVFIPPSQSLPIPWNTILGLTLPLLFWQNFRRLVDADWHGWKSVALWLAAMAIVAAALWFGGAVEWPGALLLGMIAASMIWSAGETDSEASFMSLVGPVAIIFLLLEVEAAVQSPNQYIGGIFSGIFFGLISALLGLYLIKRIPARWHSWIGIGQVYIAYWISFFAGVSAVSAALVSVLIFIWLNRYLRLGLHERTPFAPLNTWLGFIGILGLFLVLGWESHTSISTLILIEVLIGTLVGLIITWLGIRLKIPAFQAKQPFRLTALRISSLLLPTLLIWPRDLIQEPVQLAAAIGIAILVIGSAYLGLEFYFPKGSDKYNQQV